jgi:hypothetical protein
MGATYVFTCVLRATEICSINKTRNIFIITGADSVDSWIFKCSFKRENENESRGPVVSTGVSYCEIYGFGYRLTLNKAIQINHQPNATILQFIILTFIYSSTCFGRFPAHHQEFNDCSGSLWFYLRIMVIVVLFSWYEHSTTVTTIRG